MDNLPASPTTIAGLLGLLILGLVWFLRHLVTVSFPKTLDVMVDLLKNERDARASQHRDNREDNAANQRLLSDLRAEVQSKFKQIEDVLLARMGNVGNDLASDIKEVRHMIKNLEGTVCVFAERAGVVPGRGAPPPGGK